MRQRSYKINQRNQPTIQRKLIQFNYMLKIGKNIKRIVRERQQSSSYIVNKRKGFYF